jgi:hypothetical protein
MDREQVLAAYERAWSGQDEADIKEALASCWTASSTYVSPLTDSIRGIDGFTALILDFPVMFPGATMQLHGTANAHHDVACCAWTLKSTARIRTMGRDHGMSLTGVDFVQFDEQGMISVVTAFFDVERPAVRHGDPTTSRRRSGASARSGYDGRVIDLDAAAAQQPSDLAYESG